jgi:S1-C subfamily serine protease
MSTEPSGGPVVDAKGQLIGIVTETLIENN